MKRLPLALLVLLGLAAAGLAWYSSRARSHSVAVLDPAQVVVVRTPGGLLEVATLRKAEVFGWQSSHTCPPLDCAQLLGKTVSEVRVTASYVYRLPLAAQWTLRKVRDHYELVVPPLEPSLPVAFETGSMQLRTEKGTWLSPAAGPNREAVVRHLDEELARRAQRTEYKALAERAGAATVAEFAAKWLREQGRPLAQPVQVRFAESAAEAQRAALP